MSAMTTPTQTMTGTMAVTNFFTYTGYFAWGMVVGAALFLSGTWVYEGLVRRWFHVVAHRINDNKRHKLYLFSYQRPRGTNARALKFHIPGMKTMLGVVLERKSNFVKRQPPPRPYLPFIKGEDCDDMIAQAKENEPDPYHVVSHEEWLKLAEANE